MKYPKQHLVVIGATALILMATAVVLIFRGHAAKQFAEPDKKLADGSIELCSDYANLCFTRPANWIRSSILHAGLAKQNDIEINPPSGTILRFEALSSDTSILCPGNETCDITTVDITHLKHGLNIVSGVLDIYSSDSNVRSSHIPFMRLVSSRAIQPYNLQVGKSTSYSSFNPGISFTNSREVLLQISPGKEFAADKASRWFMSSEAKTAKQVLASTHIK